MAFPLKAISSLGNSNNQEPVPSISTDIARQKPRQSTSSSRSYPKRTLKLSRTRAQKDSSQMSHTQGKAKAAQKVNAAENDKGTPLVGHKQTEGAPLPDQKKQSPVGGNHPEPAANENAALPSDNDDDGEVGDQNQRDVRPLGSDSHRTPSLLGANEQDPPVGSNHPEPAIVHAGNENAALPSDNEEEGEVPDQNQSDVRPLGSESHRTSSLVGRNEQEPPVGGNHPEPAANENAALPSDNDDEGEVGDQKQSDVRALGSDSHRMPSLPGPNEQQPPVGGKKKGVGVDGKTNEADGVAVQKEKHVPLAAHKDSSGASPCEKEHRVAGDNNGKKYNDAARCPKQYTVAQGNYHWKSLYCSLSSTFRVIHSFHTCFVDIS